MVSAYQKLLSDDEGGISLQGLHAGEEQWTASTHERTSTWRWLLPGCSIALLSFLAGWKSATGLGTASDRTLQDFDGSRLSGSRLSDDILHALNLSHEHCDRLFPLHLAEIEPTRAWAQSEGGISVSHVDEMTPDMHARVVIKDGRVFLKTFRMGHHTRALAALHLLHRAVLHAPEGVADAEFTIGVDDMSEPHKGAFTLARRTENPSWLAADFGFYSWPEPGVGTWRSFQDHVDGVNRNISWQDKADQLFWRGALMRSQWRADLVAISDSNPEWGNMRAIDWSRLDEEPRVSMPDHARYRYVAATEGGDAYSGRLKYLLSTQSVVVSHPLRWQQHWHKALDGREGSPDQNIVFVRGPGWQGLEETMQALLQDPERGRRIAQNAYEMFHRRYTSPAAVACWWRTALKHYSSCLSFQPSLDEHAKPIEDVYLMLSVDWIPHKT